MRQLQYIVDQGEDGSTLRRYLLARGYSQSMLNDFKRVGGLAINGGFQRLIDPVAVGDTITVTLRDSGPVLLPNPALQLTVRYEDDDIVVYEKPDDMLVHPAGQGFDDAVGNDFAARFPTLTFRPLGRLDRHTTGLCPVAKNRLCAVALNGTIEKDYLAIVEGRVLDDDGQIEAPLIRVAGSIIQRRVDPAGKPCLTYYQVLRRLPHHTFLRLRLATGRTHQIRVHMAHLGHPLAGDDLYGGHRDLIRRQALHCGRLSFRHPVTGRTIAVHAPLPADMAAALGNRIIL